MSELETAAGASVGGFWRLRRKAEHAAPPGTPCANCATPLQGPWCYACGQLGEDFHRSIGHLLAEAFESFTHVDGRLWRTLPDLVLNPGKLTRDFLDGHRAPQIPPLRLFLVVLLALFVVGGLNTGGKILNLNNAAPRPTGADRVADINMEQGFNQLTPEQKVKVAEGVSHVNVNLGGDRPNAEATHWLRDRIMKTLADPARFQLILEQWSERFAFLMLPLSALLLSVLFIFQRRFFLFDHTIFSLHSLSAVGLLVILATGLSQVVGDSAYLLTLLAPIHLFVHMRGVYRTSVIGTLIRMFLLFVGSVISAILLILGLIAVGLNSMAD